MFWALVPWAFGLGIFYLLCPNPLYGTSRENADLEAHRSSVGLKVILHGRVQGESIDQSAKLGSLCTITRVVMSIQDLRIRESVPFQGLSKI